MRCYFFNTTLLIRLIMNELTNAVFEILKNKKIILEKTKSLKQLI